MKLCLRGDKIVKKVTIGLLLCVVVALGFCVFQQIQINQMQTNIANLTQDNSDLEDRIEDVEDSLIELGLTVEDIVEILANLEIQFAELNATVNQLEGFETLQEVEALKYSVDELKAMDVEIIAEINHIVEWVRGLEALNASITELADSMADLAVSVANFRTSVAADLAYIASELAELDARIEALETL